MANRQHKVAVIGAGFSGVTTAAHLLNQGLEVTVFERQKSAGGVWRFDPRTDPEPAYPNEVTEPPTGSRDLQSATFEELTLHHGPPGPCYRGLRNNIPVSIMRSSLMPWPEGTPDYVDHEAVEKYIQSIHDMAQLGGRTWYDTKVDSVTKTGGLWILKTRTLREDRNVQGGYVLEHTTWEFDAVVVASGHYNIPRIPSIPGLRDLKEEFPSAFLHSKSYRSPEAFKDKAIFLVGGGVSCLDIARESVGIAKKIYQSTRQGPFDIPLSMIPSVVERVGEIDRFMPSNDQSGSVAVVLGDGRVIAGIDVVILGTGYITSYPFLGPLQNNRVPLEEADETIIVTADGYTTHNLHLDIFYIPDPTLSFVGVPYHASSFSLFDFQGQVISRVLSGKAELPPLEMLQSDYRKRKAECAAMNRRLHSLAGRDLTYMLENLRWLDAEAKRLGHEPVPPIGEDFTRNYHEFLKQVQEIGLVPQTNSQSRDQHRDLPNVEAAQVLA
jgi:cation diffusion facilitator CzcD-associated flavoprotein CzcO